MQVSIQFDTEKESLEDLKKLIVALQDLVERKEKSVSLAANSINQSSQVKIEVKTQEKSVRTAGGCKTIPYEDMSGKLSEILSKQKY